MSYATKAEFAGYLGVQEADLDPSTDRMLKRASEAIDYFTYGRASADPTIQDVKDATMAQGEYWLEIDESMDIMGSPEAWSSGSFSMQGKFAEIAPRAKRHLFLAGLLSRRARLY